MSQFLLTFAIAFFTILLFALLLNYCRRKLRKTQHGLTGMCHKSGGLTCSSCKNLTEENILPP